MEIFSGPDDHARYIKWINGHSWNGFVLHSNSPPDGQLVLHRASCNLIGANGTQPPVGTVWTNYTKRCSTDRTELKFFAIERGGCSEGCKCLS
jgi:hypothetical protein